MSLYDDLPKSPGNIEEPTIPFGKCKGKTLSEIAEKDPLYLDWLNDQNIEGPLGQRIKECWKKNKRGIEEALEEKDFLEQGAYPDQEF